MSRSGPTGSITGYLNPFRDAHVSPERIDMGVDYSGSGPIYAIGPGEITSIRNAGWPGGAFIAERLTSGPYAGRYWYFAEDIQPAVQVGQRVDATTVVGHFAGGTSGIETGWAAPPGTGNTLAAVNGQACGGSRDPGCQSTWYGASASSLLQALGAPAGILSGKVVGTGPGSMPQPGGHLGFTGSGPPAGMSSCISTAGMLAYLTWCLYHFVLLTGHAL